VIRCLGPLALALCGASDPAAQTLIDSLSDTSAGAPFAAAFLRARGLDWAADLIETEAAGTPFPIPHDEGDPS